MLGAWGVPGPNRRSNSKEKERECVTHRQLPNFWGSWRSTRPHQPCCGFCRPMRHPCRFPPGRGGTEIRPEHMPQLPCMDCRGGLTILCRSRITATVWFVLEGLFPFPRRCMNLRQPRTPNHIPNLVFLPASFCNSRSQLVTAKEEAAQPLIQSWPKGQTFTVPTDGGPGARQ